VALAADTYILFAHKSNIEENTRKCWLQSLFLSPLFITEIEKGSQRLSSSGLPRTAAATMDFPVAGDVGGLNLFKEIRFATNPARAHWRMLHQFKFNLPPIRRPKKKAKAKKG
jgi:hypothetical protein